jgi:hypothetical protein
MAQIPHADEGRICPLMKQDMSLVCHKCPLWVMLRGKDPQSEEMIDRWDCSLALIPVLMIENSQVQRQTGAAVESFRNEMVKANGETLAALSAPMQIHLPQMRLPNG